MFTGIVSFGKLMSATSLFESGVGVVGTWEGEEHVGCSSEMPNNAALRREALLGFGGTGDGVFEGMGRSLVGEITGKEVTSEGRGVESK